MFNNVELKRSIMPLAMGLNPKDLVCFISSNRQTSLKPRLDDETCFMKLVS